MSEKIVRPHNKLVSRFKDGIAIASSHGKMFHVTKDGKPLYNARYKEVFPFKNGYAVITLLNGKQTHINKSGTIIHHMCNKSHDNCQDFKNCIALCYDIIDDNIIESEIRIYYQQYPERRIVNKAPNKKEWK